MNRLKNPVLSKCIFFSFINTILLLFFTLGRYNFPILNDEEAKIMMLFSGIQRSFGWIEKPHPDSVLFINTNNSIKRYHEAGNKFLTDRYKLSLLLSLLAQHRNSFQFSFFDILLEDETNEDKVLLEQVINLQDKVFFIKSTQFKEGPLLSEIPTYFATFQTIGGKQISYPLYKKTAGTKTLAEITAPLAMYLHGKRELSVSLPLFFDEFFIWIGDELHFVNPNTAPYLVMEDIDISNPARSTGQTPFYRIFDLEQVIQMEGEDFNKIINKKSIMVGDIDITENLQSDMHSTLLEDTKGILIIFNTYWMIKSGNTKLNFLWLLWFSLFLWIMSYFLILKSYYGISPLSKVFALPSFIQIRSIRKINILLENRFTRKIGAFLNKFLSIGLLFFIASSLSYFIFNIQISIFMTALLVSIESSILNIIGKTK